jgi:acyl-CoA reductase-like NAD-dependent aldehyde dehydrogenase
MSKIILPKAEWQVLLKQIKTVTPEIFNQDGKVLNLMEGEWKNPGHGKQYYSCIDGTLLGKLPMLDLEAGKKAVAYAATEFKEWSKTDLEIRKEKVSAVLNELKVHQELLAYTLTWEIGKPIAQTRVSVERCISGVEWYIDNIEGMMQGRKPLGLISNIASWNYPMSVLMHAVLIQALAGNSVIAKTPTDGGLYALSLACAIAKRAGLPVTLISGSGGELSEALVRNHNVACLSYVGGKSNGRDIALSLLDKNKRYMLEMEGVNSYGIWNFSDWDGLAKQLKKGFEYGKQRCTAYVRFVIQRDLFPKFLDMYIPLLKSLKYGHPLLVNPGETEAPTLDFGPVINSKKVEELQFMYTDALSKGAISIFKGEFAHDAFMEDQDVSAYFAPASLLNVPKNSQIYYNEPFGPLDSIVIVDREEELIAEMNVSNGNLVSSLACDDSKTAKRLASEVRAFKVGINQVRSRGDKEESFGGIGQSWKGCFVGGKYLIHAVTVGPANERLLGNFPDYTSLPENVNQF